MARLVASFDPNRRDTKRGGTKTNIHRPPSTAHRAPRIRLSHTTRNLDDRASARDSCVLTRESESEIERASEPEPEFEKAIPRYVKCSPRKYAPASDKRSNLLNSSINATGRHPRRRRSTRHKTIAAIIKDR